MWQVISQNPKFQQSAFGGYMTEDRYNALPQQTKDHLNSVFGNPGSPSPVLDIKPQEVMPPQTQPVLNADPNPYLQPKPEPEPVPTGYEDYSVQDFLGEADRINTSPVLSGDMNRGIEPVDPIMKDPQRSDAYLGSLSKEKLRELAAAGNLQAAALLQANIPDAVEPPVVPEKPVLNMPGYTMPSAMEVPKPVLVDTTEPTAPTTVEQAEPILRSGGQGRSTGALSAGSITSSSGPKTSNARGSMMPQMLIDRNEALIRIGGAMYSGALKGDGIGAATQEYGRIQGENREQARKMAEAEQKRKLEEARLRAARAGGGKSGTKGSGGKGAGELRFGISKLNSALDLIKNSEGSLTGWNPSAIFSRFVGKTVGNEEEAQRLFLNEIGLDQIMTRVAETKGAISNAEMALFGRQVPQLGSQEIVWERWLQRQIQMSEVLLNRLENGDSVDPNAPLSETMPGMGGGSSSGLTQEDLDFIKQ